MPGIGIGTVPGIPLVSSRTFGAVTDNNLILVHSMFHAGKLSHVLVWPIDGTGSNLLDACLGEGT